MPRLLLVIPVTSCGAERFLSSLLKTWLRRTMMQERLNNMAVCNVHHKYVDGLDLKTIFNEFSSMKDHRLELFLEILSFD